MHVLKYCCAACDSVAIITTDNPDMESLDMVDCMSCLGYLCCYPIENPFDVADYLNELNLIQEDLEQSLPTRPATALAAENKDLRASIIELKEWAEVKRTKAAHTIKTHKMYPDRGFREEVEKRRTAMDEMVEHCLAALEGKASEETVYILEGPL